MFRTTMVSALILTLSFSLLQTPSVFADTLNPAETARIGKIKTGVAQLGTGEQARVKIRLRDKTNLEGYISDAGPDSFTVRDHRTGAATVVSYPDVGQIKGQNLSRGAKIAIGVGIAVAVITVTAVLLSRRICNERC